MKNAEVFSQIKDLCFPGIHGEKHDKRDVLVYGDGEDECTGVLLSCYPSVGMIKRAHELGANLMVVSESIFWNHGEPTDWLGDDKVFLSKKTLLDDYGLTVYRIHDSIANGITYKGRYVGTNGYGLAKALGWEDRLMDVSINDYEVSTRETVYRFEGQTVRELARYCVDKLHINGAKIYGDPDTKVYKLYNPWAELMGIPGLDDKIINNIEKEDIDCVIGQETMDFCVSAYIRDSVEVGRPRAVLQLGHFNVEEEGMRLLTESAKDHFGSSLPVYHDASGDPASLYVI